jgi:lipid-binding SYLF domain-containing protein
MLRALRIAVLASVPLIGFVGGCHTAPETREEQTDLRSTAAAAVNNAYDVDPTLRSYIDRSAGYAVFPTVGKGGLIIGGGYGKGVLFEHGVATGYCDMTQATVGAQIGGQKFTEIIAFQTPEAVQNFKNGNFALNAQATAVALQSGAAANAKPADNVTVFALGEKGLMAEATVGGQKFRFQPVTPPASKPAM